VPTLRAEISWCLGMSEPGAGSDLAALSTRAEAHDDHFVVSGQKIWTSGAHHADYCFCFVRTDPAAPKHRGISVLIIDMKAKGITTRPLPDLLERDRADFNEVFFDGVLVPRDHLSARSTGLVDLGWLAGARARHDVARAPPGSTACSNASCAGARRGPTAPDRGATFRDELASSTSMPRRSGSGYQGFAKFAKGQSSPEHSVLKLFGSEVAQRAARVATEALGVDALEVEFHGMGDDESSGEMPWLKRYLQSYGATISAGASEIQRNIIAQRVLGLPRR
jgi:alkylation response protein AidB-like acyl-CoA dehydrogenase